MNINLPAEQQAFVEGLVSSGQYSSAEEAISAALHLLLSREQLKQQIDVGVAQADRGELHSHDTVFDQLRSLASTATERGLEP